MAGPSPSAGLRSHGPRHGPRSDRGRSPSPSESATSRPRTARSEWSAIAVTVTLMPEPYDVGIERDDEQQQAGPSAVERQRDRHDEHQTGEGIVGPER